MTMKNLIGPRGGHPGLDSTTTLVTSTFDVWYHTPIVSSERSTHMEHDSSSEVEKLRREFKLALEHMQASMMYAMRSMMS